MPEELAISDHILNVSAFREQTVLKGKKALINMFLNLLFMPKNTVQKMPELGFDIMAKKHKLMKTSELASMEEELRWQVREFMPGYIRDIKFEIEDQRGDILITVVTTEDDVIEFETDPDAPISDLEIKLPDKDFSA